MTTRTGLRQLHVLGLTILFITVVAAVSCTILIAQGVEAKPRSIRVGDAARPAGWQTIAYRDAKVAIPGDWRRMDTSDCDFSVDAWVPPNAIECDLAGPALRFYAEETYDANQGPGQISGSGEMAGGYEIGGQVAVSATASESIVRSILDSVATR